MALVKNNSLTEGISGAIGGMLVFKQLNGRTYATRKPALPTKQSELQRKNRSKFKQATYYAKQCMLDAEKKAYYWRKAKKLKLPNAYTAAITDYMRRGEIKAVETKQVKGKVGDNLYIHVKKKDFAVKDVTVSLLDNRGNTLEVCDAIRKEPTMFMYKLALDYPPGMHIVVRTVIKDHGYNIVNEKAVVI